MRIIFLTVALFPLFALSPLYCDKVKTPIIDTNPLDYQHNFQHIFLLPLDASKKLGIHIPENFAPIQSVNQFGNSQEVMIEYIPKNEDPDNWNEIITLNKFIGKRIQAKPFVELFKKTFSTKVKSCKILSSNSSKNDSIEQSFLIMQYMHDKKQEVIGAFYISGPYDLSGVQYTIRLKSNQTVSAAAKKIKDFFSKNSQVITHQ